DTDVLTSRTRVTRKQSMRADPRSAVTLGSSSDNLIGYVYNEGQIVTVPRLREGEECEWDLAFLRHPEFPGDVTGFIAAPILGSDGEVLGVIVVFNKTQEDAVYTEYDVFSMEQIAQFSSNAFKNWSAIDAARHAKDRMEMLIGMIKHISNELDANEVIDKMFQ
ncbi:hypothetical protein TeGR_g9907, partial [Tetraparma gracilis]